MKINLGCGQEKRVGYVNVDWNPEVTPDVVHDLNILPYPFTDSSVKEIVAHHVLEHLDKPFSIMKEFHRILEPGGVVSLRVPHFSRGFTHAEHCHGFDISFPKYFSPKFTPSGYVGVEFELESMELRWMSLFHLLPYFGYGPLGIGFLRLVDKMISSLARCHLGLCSRIWCFWVGGFEEIRFQFRCIK